MPVWTKEQKEAIEKSGSNIIVSAGAGSGKTAVLSERVLYKLTHGVHINELLILTFTRAAAEEMKDRIRKKIKKEETLKDELAALNSSYITTFDSFALSVVKKYHYLLNISKDIKVTDESIIQIEKKRILDEVFENFYKEKNEKFESLIRRYCNKNDNSIRKSISELANKIENFINPETYLKWIKTGFYESDNINKIIDSYIKFIDEKKKIVSLELTNISNFFDENYVRKLEEIILPILNTESLDEFSKYSSFRLPNSPKGTEEEAKAAKEKLKQALSELLSYTKYKNEENIKNEILSSKDTVLTIVEIIETYFKKLKEYKIKNEIYTFQDIASLATQIVYEFEDARLELKDSFKEIMIDEYQDTNDIQENFIKMIANNNVYMVGDIKQSIYRFRGSNPIIFKEKYDSYSLNNDGYKIDLIKNFRSRKQVLDNINRIFDLIMDNALGGAEYYESHEMVFGNSAYNEECIKDFNYNFEVLEYQNEKNSGYTNSEIEIFTIAKDIKSKINSKLQVFDKDTSKLRPIKYSDFVIILDRSKYFDDYKRIFEYLDIPLAILKDGKLNSSTDISIIKNIVDFIIRIKNNDFGTEFKYDFMSIGRSFLYEYEDQYLFDALTQNKIFETKLYKDFNNIENYNSMTASRLFDKILDITDFYNKIYRIGDYENINVRLETISNLSNNLNNIGMSIEDFRDYLSEIIENDYEIKYTAFSDNVDSVKILTIHKSKGLEYPICYFADLDHKFNTMELNDKFIVDANLGLITPRECDDEASVQKILYKDTFTKEEISEKIRLFYVALTRAREKIIIVIPNKDTEKLEKNENGTIEMIRRLKFSKLSDFIYGIKDYLESYFQDVNIEDLNLSKDYLYNKPLNKIKTNTELEDFKVEEINVPLELVEDTHFSKDLPELISLESSKNMEFGTKVHEVFELIDFKNYDPNIIHDEFIRTKVSKFLQNDLLKNVKNAEIYHEYEFTYQYKNTNYHGIIDLILEYSDHIDIIDYKLKNTKDKHYIEQLNGYKKYIEELTGKVVNTYLYSIIDEIIVEI